METQRDEETRRNALAEAAEQAVEDWAKANPRAVARELLMLRVQVDTLYVGLVNGLRDEGAGVAVKATGLLEWAKRLVEPVATYPEAAKRLLRDVRCSGETLASEADARSAMCAALENVNEASPEIDPFLATAKALGWTGDGSPDAEKAGASRVREALHTAAVMRLQEG